MNLTEVKKSIDSLMAMPHRQCAVRNIIFWYDDYGTYKDDIDSLKLDSGKILKLEDNSFYIKAQIEIENKTDNFLIYSDKPRPKKEYNFLIDIEKYSRIFATDETTINMLTYGIDEELKPIVKLYDKFFRNNDRTKRFESYGLTSFSTWKLHIAFLSALCKLSKPDFDGIIKGLLVEYAEGSNSSLSSIKSFGNEHEFWNIISEHFKYRGDNMGDFATSLLLNHVADGYKCTMPDKWKSHISAGNTNSIVFVDNFMNGVSDSENYSNLAQVTSKKLNLFETIQCWDMEDYIDVSTFVEFDLQIIRRIAENLTLGIDQFEKYRKIINHRRKMKYAIELSKEYDCIYFACKLFEMEKEWGVIKGIDCTSMAEEYSHTYYKFDMEYRHFLQAYDKIVDKDILSNLFEKVENTYTNWFLKELSVKWSSLMDENMLENYNDIGMEHQNKFYEKYVSKFIETNDRIVVIISDALRYEVGVELAEVLNRQLKGSTDILPMISAIPSYTKLGMAALLPHDKLEMKANGDVLIDGINTAGTANREKVLKTVCDESIALVFEELLNIPNFNIGLKEKIGGKKLIYIYHNAIDAVGDHAATERNVFDGAKKAIDELAWLVERLRKSNLSIINIIITADHGFVYRRTPLQASDKTPKDMDKYMESGKRYILSNKKDRIDGTDSFSMDYLLGTDSGINAIIPKGVNCYRVSGTGFQFIHGGSSLSEVIIPVIKFRSDKNISADLGAKHVNLSITNISRKITSKVSYMDFFQNEVVNEKMLGVKAKAYFSDNDGNKISSETTIIADSRSIKPIDRTYHEKFVFKNIRYSNKNEYWLVVENEDYGYNMLKEKFTVEVNYDKTQ